MLHIDIEWANLARIFHLWNNGALQIMFLQSYHRPCILIAACYSKKAKIVRTCWLHHTLLLELAQSWDQFR